MLLNKYYKMAGIIATLADPTPLSSNTIHCLEIQLRARDISAFLQHSLLNVSTTMQVIQHIVGGCYLNCASVDLATISFQHQ